MKAAVLNQIPGELEIEDISVDKPGPNEVLVQVVNAGLCHSDLHFMDAAWQTGLPAVMGHESAGVVQAVGADVAYVKPGDHVITCLSVFCGNCDLCLTGRPNLCRNNAAVSRSKDAAPRLTKPDGTPVEQFARLGQVPFDTRDQLAGPSLWRWHGVQLLRRSALLMEVHDRLLDRKGAPPAPGDIERGLQRAGEHLMDLATRSQEHGWQAAVAVIPHEGALTTGSAHARIAARVLAQAEQSGLPALDLLPALAEFAATTGGSTLLPYDGHYSGAANRAMGRSAAQQLLEVVDLER